MPSRWSTRTSASPTASSTPAPTGSRTTSSASGVEPDERVAICVERAIEMVVALLAILKAGGAYVPLDPAYPAERLAFMLADSAPGSC